MQQGEQNSKQIQQTNLIPKKDRQKAIKEILKLKQEEKYSGPNPLGDNIFPENNIIEFQVIQNSKPIKLHTYNYSPKDNKILGIFIVYHGLCSHIGNFAHIAKELANSGFLVTGFDYRGFGRSEGIRGYIESQEQHIQDSYQYLQLIKKKYGDNVPIILGGQSLGGSTAFQLSLKYPDQIQGLVLFAPALRDNGDQQFSKKIGKLASKCIPKLRLISFNLNDDNKNKNIAQDLKKDQYYYSDKMGLHTIKVVLDMMDQNSQNLQNLQSDFLIIQGGKDKIVDPFAAEDLIEQSKSQVKQLIYLENCWHNIWMEEEIFDVIPQIQNWLIKKLQK